MNSSFDKTEGNDEWLTPPEIVEALGDFDLDPCSPVNRPWDTAERHYTKIDDGLAQEWVGRVWCNPPYGKQLGIWLKKCAKHKNCTVMIFARTETRAFFEHVWGKARAVMFLQGRVSFYKVDGTEGGTAGAPSILLAYDEENAKKLKESGLKGFYIDLPVTEAVDGQQDFFG